VFAYAQSVSDQMAVTDGCVGGDPSQMQWNYTCILITATSSWNIDSANILLNHMRRDHTGSAFVLVSCEDSPLFVRLKHYSVEPPIRMRSLAKEAKSCSELSILMHIAPLRKMPLTIVEMSSREVGDVRSMFRLPALEEPCYERVKVHRNNERSSGVQGQMPPWWRSLLDDWSISGCGDNSDQNWIYSSLKNRRFMQPDWMRGWYHDRDNLPDLGEISCPGNCRAENAGMLPDAPADDHSLKVITESIQPNPEIFRIETPVNVDRLEELMSDFPNKIHSDSWIKALRVGLWPWSGNFAQDPPEGVIFPNRDIMDKHRSFVNSVRVKEVSMGHWRELKDVPKYFRNSPISVVPKPEGGSRLIQNLSFPEGNSVNDQIPVREGRVTYDDIGSLAKVIVVLHSKGITNWVPWKLDVSRAFRNIPLHPLFALRNGIILKSRSCKPLHFIDSQACFGGRAFPRAYCSIADLVGWIANKKYGVDILLRFVDDHFGISPVIKNSEEPKDMKHLRVLFNELNIPTNDKYGFGDGLVIIGKEVNYHDATIQLSKEKLMKYLTMCTHFLKRRKITLNDVDHISGVLNYCLDVSLIGKPFNRAFDLIKGRFKTKHRNYLMDMTKTMLESLQWWAYTLSCRPIRYLLEEYWWSSEQAEEVLFTDASTSYGLGVYWIRKKSAYYHLYDPTQESTKILQGPRQGASVHINTMELLAVVSAVQIISNNIQIVAAGRKTRVVIMCDNAAVCESVYKMSSSDIIMIELLKDLILSLENIDLRVCHISTDYNPADYLTKGKQKLMQFQRLFTVDTIFQFEPLALDRHLKTAQLTDK